MSDYILVRTTVPTRELARQIADALLSRRLAASVHVNGPTESRYWWQGEIRRGEEWVCEIRTTTRARAPVEELVRELHPYELPELFATAMLIDDPELEAWLDQHIDT